MMEKTPQGPFLQISFSEQGILLTTVVSTFKQEILLIPIANADAMTMTWLASRPDEIFKQALQMRREAKAQKEMIDHAVMRLKA